MKRQLLDSEPPPARRPLKVFAGDPMIQRQIGGPLHLDVAYEAHPYGLVGDRIVVIDYDATRDRFYEPVNLDDPMILLQGGLDPCESDPRSHQQMVYAVATKVLETFDAALGRRLRFYRGRKLRLLPHAFQGGNAFYDPEMLAILFGYFRASKRHAGRHQPGQYVFSCLSHDIIAHEMTHAMLDRIKHFFRYPTGRDTHAFHEAIADIVTILHQFSFPALLRSAIARQRGDLRKDGPLVQLAEQFGQTSGSGKALRSAIDVPDFELYRRTHEQHARGAILSAAVFSAFLRTYERRTSDLIRIATGGTGVLPAGDLAPDLVDRLAAEASAAARSMLDMCIRALEYTAPVDITFGDYLRALVTADYELDPHDKFGGRTALIEEFLKRGLCPEHVRSPSEDALRWDEARGDDRLPDLPAELIGKLFLENAAMSLDHSLGADEASPQTARLTHGGEASRARDGGGELAATVESCLHRYAIDNRARLGLEENVLTRVSGFHSSFRTDAYGQPAVELVAQIVQSPEGAARDPERLTLLGGTTIIAGLNGKIRYVIHRKIPLSNEAWAKERRRDQAAMLDDLDSRDAVWGFTANEERMRRMRLRTPFRRTSTSLD